MQKKKEFLGFSKSMLLQCLVLFIGICGGLCINRYIYFIVFIYSALKCFSKNINNIFYNLLFTISFTVIYKLTPQSSSFFAYMVVVAGVVLSFRIKYLKTKPILPMLFFVACLLFGVGDNYFTAIKMITGLMLLYFFVSNVKRDDFKNHMMAFTLGVLGSCIVGTFKETLPILQEYLHSDITLLGRSGVVNRFAGLNYDPNFFSMSIIFSVVLCLILLMNKSGNRIFLWILTIVNALFGFQSYSKMFLLSITIVILLSLLYMMRSPQKIIAAVVVIGIVGIGLYFVMKKIGYMEIMLGRLSGGDISTGRFELWEYYIEYIEKSMTNVIFGVGLGKGYLYAGGPHNTYIEAVYYVGVIGSLFLLITIMSIFDCKRYNHRRNIMNYVLVFVFLVMNGVLGCFTVNELFFYCMLVWIGLNINTEKSVLMKSERMTVDV